MARLAEMMAECAIAVPQPVPVRRGSAWQAMRDISIERPFSVPEVAIAAKLSPHEVGSLSDYVARLARGGFISLVKERGKQKYYRVVKDQQAAPQVQADGSVHEFESRLTVVIPRSEAGIWASIQEIGKRGREFSAEALFDRMQAALPIDEITDYLARLTRGGFLEMSGVTTRDGRVTKAWRLLRWQPETPRLSRDGQPLVSPMRAANLWRAMKMAGYFTALDLASSASLPGLAVTQEMAARYAADLAAAGYLQCRVRDGQAPVYRLKSVMNTGPAAPEVLRARFVWDPNLRRIVGELAQIEEVRA